MPWSFWASYLLKLGVIGALLATLYAAARALHRVRFFANRGDRSINVIESVALSPHAAVYLVRVGTRCLLIGTSSASITKLAELAPKTTSRD